MSAHDNTFWKQLDRSRRGTSALRQRDTHWGFILSSPTPKTLRGLAEAVLKMLAMAVIFAAIVPWIVLGGPLAELTLLVRALISAGFFVVGFGIYTHAGRGFQSELHVDAVQMELRLSTRNARNMASTRRRIAMSDVESCFLKRAKASGEDSQMLVRLKGRTYPVALARGPEHDLVPALERIADMVRASRRSRKF